MRDGYTSSSHAIPTLFIFLLIGLFALTSLTLTLIGTRVYRHVSATASQTEDAQMALSYLCNKVHTADTRDGVAIGERDGHSVLLLYEAIEGETYETSVYAYQDAIWEQFVPVGNPFDPANGERLLDAASLRFALLAPNLIEATLVLDNGETHTLRMALQAGVAGEAN